MLILDKWKGMMKVKKQQPVLLIDWYSFDQLLVSFNNLEHMYQKTIKFISLDDKEMLPFPIN